MDYYSSRDDLETEAGVSYLMKAGGSSVLFDLGLNIRDEDEPALLRNMRRIGVTSDDIDYVVISHPHSDHLGGMRNKLQAKAAIAEKDDPIADMTVYSTVPLQVVSGRNTVIEKPCEISPGVGTTGPLPAPLLLGYTLEQSLVFNVRGKGPVVVIGCGHPGLEHIIEQAEWLAGEPLYGIIGGLHYPVTEDRRRKGLLKPQKLFGNPNPPWRPITKKLVRDAIELLKGKDLQIVSLSPHDSCDWALSHFEAAFGSNYRRLLVGEQIIV